MSNAYKKTYHTLVAGTLGVLFFVPLVSLGAVASSTNYLLERDSINIGGVLSTTSTYALEDTAGELYVLDLNGEVLVLSR